MLKSPCASQGMPAESTMSPKAAKRSRLMPLGPKASCRYSERARSCRRDAVYTVTPTMRCIRSLGTCQAISAAC
eukprot:3914715-Pyramimonas_sp.AAC.1